MRKFPETGDRLYQLFAEGNFTFKEIEDSYRTFRYAISIPGGKLCNKLIITSPEIYFHEGMRHFCEGKLGVRAKRWLLSQYFNSDSFFTLNQYSAFEKYFEAKRREANDKRTETKLTEEEKLEKEFLSWLK